MFLVTDGTLNAVTNAIVVDREGEIEQAVKTLVAYGADRDKITVNPVGPPR